jgi:hypothetical protein
MKKFCQGGDWEQTPSFCLLVDQRLAADPPWMKKFCQGGDWEQTPSFCLLGAKRRAKFPPGERNRREVLPTRTIPAPLGGPPVRQIALHMSRGALLATGRLA